MNIEDFARRVVTNGEHYTVHEVYLMHEELTDFIWAIVDQHNAYDINIGTYPQKSADGKTRVEYRVVFKVHHGATEDN